MTEVTLVVPTFNRKNVLARTIERLAQQEGDAAFEVLIADDGSTDGTAEYVRGLAHHFPARLDVIELAKGGPAAARNRGLAVAAGRVTLFLGDDTWPRPDLVQRHAVFHRQRTEPEAALLGNVVWAAAARPSSFMEWLGTEGIQFGFALIEDSARVPGSCFYTSNVSVKTAFIRAHGGFDEAFLGAAFEDIDLGLRLERAGMRLNYDPEAIVEHFHPIDLAGALERVRGVGYWGRLLVERNPDWPVPRRPGSRHQLKAAALTLLFATRIRTHPLRTAVWRFLCHEAYREGYWDVSAAGPQPLRIGAALAHLAAGDPATRIGMPKPRDSL